MKARRDPLRKEQHRRIGSDLFNYTWTLLDRPRLRPADVDEMLNAAHASRYHWGHAGTALNRSIAEWQLSRVYATLGRSEPALYHGRRALQIARHDRLGRFYLAYAYEGMARASALSGDRRSRARYVRQARTVGARIRDRADRERLLADLSTIR